MCGRGSVLAESRLIELPRVRLIKLPIWRSPAEARAWRPFVAVAPRLFARCTSDTYMNAHVTRPALRASERKRERAARARLVVRPVPREERVRHVAVQPICDELLRRGLEESRKDAAALFGVVFVRHHDLHHSLSSRACLTCSASRSSDHVSWLR